jgi:hypothetical protein
MAVTMFPDDDVCKMYGEGLGVIIKILGLLIIATTPHLAAAADAGLQKWKKAVVNIEGAANSESDDAYIKQIQQLSQQLWADQITVQQYMQGVIQGSRDIRFHGTAIFLEHNGQRYLLTARHVVWDSVAAKRDLEELQNSVFPGELQWRQEKADNEIYRMIYRVPSLDEIKEANSTNSRSPEVLMNLGAGCCDLPYIFSKRELDLAVISLGNDKRFGDELITLGYKPISIEDIGDEPSSEGSDVFTVGFPDAAAVAQIPEIAVDRHEQIWRSSYYSLPVFAFGKIAMLRADVPFYLIDLSAWPGNSGGPIVEGQKLVGIVSEQARVELEQLPGVAVGIPVTRAIKAKYFPELIKILEGRRASFEQMLRHVPPSPETQAPSHN